MSRYLQHNELVYELYDNEMQRLQRRAKLRVVYAIVDPGGWDAQRLTEGGGNPAVLWAGLKEARASQQASDHSGDRLAGHVPGRPAALAAHRVDTGPA